MRTPGQDFELAAGFLFTEGIVDSPKQIDSFEHVGNLAPGAPLGNTVWVELAPSLTLDPQRFQRHFYTTSSCGVCGKGSLEAIKNIGIPWQCKILAEVRHIASSIFWTVFF